MLPFTIAAFVSCTHHLNYFFMNILTSPGTPNVTLETYLAMLLLSAMNLCLLRSNMAAVAFRIGHTVGRAELGCGWGWRATSALGEKVVQRLVVEWDSGELVCTDLWLNGR
jgi:hypothetical protein